MATAATLPSASVLAKKASLLEQSATWRIVRCQGMRRIVMPNETGSRVYLVDPSGKACNCKAGQFGTLCAHRLAAIERANQDALAAWVDEQGRSTGNREGVLGYLDAVSAGDDHEAARAAGHRARVTYEMIWPEGDD